MSSGLPPGSVVANRFRIVGAIAEGGMGAVYRAVDIDSDLAVALKVLHTAHADDVTRLHREAATLAALRHPGIVAYIAHGEISPTQPYIVMEWAAGQTLASRLLAGRLPIDEAMARAGEVARALGSAHRVGVVHRDIKPANLILDDKTGAAKLIDFGIAQQATRWHTLTKTGVLVGTPGYMAPEQARGGREVSPATDVFSLGCVLFEMVTGRPPFSGEHLMAVLAKILFEDVPDMRTVVADVPSHVAELVRRLMAKAPSDRPQNGDAVSELLVAAGQLATPVSTAPATLRTRRHLTTREQRIVSVVVASNRSLVRDSDTILRPPAEASRTALVNLLQPLGARAEPLADGSLVVTLEGQGTIADIAAQAARCALGLRGLLPDVPMALATGRAVVHSEMPLGAVVDRAVALLPPASPTRAAWGGPALVAIDEPTAGLLDARFVVRGDERGLYLYGEQTIESSRTLLGQPTKCVGRDRELYTLAATFAECATEEVARAVLITGAAGIGKSRLRYELIHHIKKEHPELTLFIGRAESHHRGAPLSLLADAIRRECGIEHGEPTESQQRKLRARVSRHLGNAAPDTAVFIGEMIGVRFDAAQHEALRVARRNPAMMSDLMRQAWQAWIDAEAQHQPVLIILEDLQWTDVPTVSFVDTVLRNLRDRPIFVLGLGRSEVRDAFPSLWQERDVQELRLSGLTRRAAEKLVDQALGERVTESLRSNIVRLADGNAFFLEELIRAVASGEGERLPDSIVGMVQSRLDSLSQNARSVLRAGSVLGERFWDGAVGELSGLPTEEVARQLDELCEREMLSRRTTSSLLDETEYVFRSTLLREACYATLTDEDRVLGHQLAAIWLETRLHANSDESGVGAAALADHFRLGNIGERAARWYVRAAEQSLDANDLPATMHYAEAALATGATGALAGLARLRLAQAHSWSGRPEAAVLVLEAALDELTPQSSHWYAAIGELTEAQSRQGNVASAVGLLERAAATPSAATARSAQVDCLARSAIRAVWGGQQELGAQLTRTLDRLVADRQTSVDAGAEARVCELRAWVAFNQNDPFGNLEGLEQACAAHERAGDARTLCQCSVWLGYAYLELGLIERACDTLEQAHASAQSLAIPTIAANALHNLGLALALRGDPARGLKIELQSLVEFAALGEPRKLGHAHWYLGEIHLLAGNGQKALVEAEQAAALLAKLDEHMLIEVLPFRVEALLLLGRSDEALACSTDVIAEYGDAPSAMRAWSAHAAALHALGRLDEARTALRRALTLLEARVANVRHPEYQKSARTQAPSVRPLRALAKALDVG